MDDDLDDELRRLFSDDRLDVHVTPDATDAVVRGADRRRRRRTAVTGAFAVVTLVGAGIGLSLLRPPVDDAAGELLPTSSSTASDTPSSVPVSTYVVTSIVTAQPPPSSGGATPGKPGNNTGKPSNTPPPPITPESGRGAFGDLALGMSEADALKTGVLIEPSTTTDPEAHCKSYATQSVADGDAVIISAAKGIARITLPSYAKSTKNIGAGSTVAAAKTAYPSATQSGSELLVAMTATPRWIYVFENDGTTVTRVRMRLAGGDCPGA